MRRIVATIVSLSFLAFAGGTAAAAGRVPPFPHLPDGWSHAEINVTIKHTPHTLILDRGLIVQAGSSQLTLREPDGSVVVIPLSKSTIVTLYTYPAKVLDLRKRMNAQTMRIDGGAAVRVRASF